MCKGWHGLSKEEFESKLKEYKKNADQISVHFVTTQSSWDFTYLWTAVSDILMILGKGVEEYQIVKNTNYNYSDIQTVKDSL